MIQKTYHDSWANVQGKKRSMNGRTKYYHTRVDENKYYNYLSDDNWQ
jgi:hypothetical protein